MLIRKSALLAACAAALAISQPAPGKRNAPAARSGSWTIIGPGGGGAMFHPTVSPHTTRDVMVACDMTGTYISHDAGETWRIINLGSPASLLVFDPVDPNTIYAGAAGLWRSTDRGRAWKLVFPDPATSRVEMIDDHASPRRVLPGGRSARVAAFAVDPADSKSLYMVLTDRSAASLHVSADRGRTWQESAPLPGGGARIWIDPKSPRANRTLYVAGRNSIAVRRGGEWRQGPAPEGVEAFANVSAGFRSDGQLAVYAVSPAGIHVSADGGASWRTSGLDSRAQYRAIATALNRPETAYASYSGYQPSILGPRYFGVAKTTDSGKTWQTVWREAREAGANIHDAWLTERFGPGWPSAPLALGVAPSDPEICYGTDYGRTMRTVDGGRTWEAAYSKKVAGGWTSTGLDVTTNYGVHFDPFDARRIFISYTDIGMFRSEDGGASWVSSTTGVPRPWVNTTYWIEFDPKVKGRAWAVASGIHDLPRPKMWRRQRVADYNGGVLVTSDGGRTWSIAGTMPPTAATHLLIDPTSPAQSRTLYVAGYGRGVFKSTDGGNAWKLMNRGIAGGEPFAWRLGRASDGTLYVVVARRSEDGSIGTALDGALYRSTDGAGNWTRVALPEGVNGPNGLAIDPRDSKRLFLAAWRRAVPGPDGGGGVYASSDGGTSWKRVLAEDQHVYDVTIDPRNPNVMYACGFSSAAWRSADRGATWRKIPGYDFKWGHRVIPDPRDPGRIYITTFGGSVWSKGGL